MGKAANRIIIGDVGSGKTIVALISILSYLKSGLDEKQMLCGSFMAPTEVLANQHFESLKKLILTLNLNWLDIVLVTNSNRYINNEKTTKIKLEKFLQTRTRPLLIVGTQAILFLENININFAITDEQHRFGVKQRKKLSTNPSNPEENDFEPKFNSHFVSMSATPIPRTLALTVYGDLKTSFIQKINSRSPITTEIVNLDFFSQVQSKILNQIQNNRKIYIIVPSISSEEKKEMVENESKSLWDIPKTESFFKQFFPEVEYLTLHGKQKEKNEILNEFKFNENVKALIATTVIEVGVDVESASVILIFNPERFGLAQLHQLRGRIGRNNFKDNYCYLLIDENYKEHIPRLKFLTKSNNGFEIAQEDLKLRGQGNLLGTEQSGNLEELYGLDSEQYYEIKNIVDKIDLENIQIEKPLLYNFIKQKISDSWQE